MRASHKLLLRLRSLFFRRRADYELESELSFHLDQLTEENISRGLLPDEARRLARLTVGNLTGFQEECRDMRRVNYIDDLWRDLRYAGRNLRRAPGFAALGILIMALGIGANTAVFSVVNAVLLKPLAYRNPDRIVTLTNSSTTREASTALSKQVSIPDVQDWRNQSSSFEAMAYYTSHETAVMTGRAAEYARLTSVSPGFFQVFAIEPLIGRVFSPDETKRGANGAALISYAYWQSRFGGDPRALGRLLGADGTRPIVGVLPPGFGFPGNTDIWVSEVGPSGSRGGQNYLAIGRLKTGMTVEQAQTGMTVIARHLEQQFPETNRGRSVRVTRLQDEIVSNVRLTLYLLLASVAVVLLIACANTATLLLGKASVRAREVAVRTALGAGRKRIVRQLVTESLLLALVAGFLGLAFAYWGSKALVALAPADIPRLAEVGVDRWVLGFTLGISVITSILFGSIPAFYASRVDLSDALKQGGARIASGGRTAGIRGALVAAEIALAVMLVCAAGLLIKSYVALNNVTLGFRPENVLVMRATVPAPPSVNIERTRVFFKDMLARVAGLRGVLAAGATMAPPGYVDSTGAYFIDRLPPQSEWQRAPSVVLSVVAPGTFAALGIPLQSGRDFSDSDTAGRSFVAVVNQALVRKSFSNQDPLGRTIFCPFDSLQGMKIVGVVGDVRQRGPDREPMPECYLPYGQHAFNGAALSLVVRTTGDPNALVPALRSLAHDSNPEAPMKFTTMEAMLSENVAAPRFRTILFAGFAGLAVCLALAGIYGVVAYAVSRRSNEVGLRIALGSSTGGVVRLILGQGLTLACIGLGLGLTASIAGARLLKSMLFEVQPNDPWVYCAVALLVSVVTLVACYIPARRAARIDPVAALRQE
ncbi:MAG TPA: ABC transporter permease [Bryobacteraceae bacterium]|nr:ABC transporter permease [Bryobacteraceae bacterium]